MGRNEEMIGNRTQVRRAREIMNQLDLEDDGWVRADLFDEIIGLADDDGYVAEEWAAYR